MSFLDAIDPKRGGIGAALRSNLLANEKYIQESDVEMKAATERAKEKSAKIDVEEAKLDPNVLTPPKLEKWTAPPQTSPLEAFGSSAGVLAALGGLLTRQPLTASLNAAAGVLDAYKRKDAAAAQTAFDEWKINTENAVKLAHFELDAYRAALSKIDTDRAGTYAEVKNLTAVFQNHTANQILVTQGLDGIEKYERDMRDFALKSSEAQPKLAEAHAVQQNLLQYEKYVDSEAKAGRPISMPDQINEKNRILSKQRRNETAGGVEMQILADARRQYAREHPEAPDMPADQEAKVISSSKSRSASSPVAVALNKFIEENPEATADQVAAFLQKTHAAPRSAPAAAMLKFMEEHKDATSEDLADFGAHYRARGNAVSAFATGAQGNIVRSFNTVSSHIETLEKLTDALDNGDMRQFNRLGNEFAVQTGHAAPTNFDTAKTIIGNEIVKSIIGAAGTGEDRDKAQAMFDRANSPEQLHEAIGVVKELIKGQLTGLERQYQDTTGKDDFRTKLSGAAAKMLGVSTVKAPTYDLPTVKSDDDFAALPSGAEFIDPHGKIRRKP